MRVNNFFNPIDKNSGNYSLTPDPKHRLTGLETDMPKTICYYSTNFFKCNYRLGRMETNVSCPKAFFFVHTSQYIHIRAVTFQLDTVQDFLIKFGIKPRMHLWEISIFSLNNAIVRPIKNFNGADKNCAHFQKAKYFKNENF